MADDADGLELEIEQELGETREQFRQKLIAISGVAIRGVIKRTPIDTGFAVNSYQVLIGDINLPTAVPPASNEPLTEAQANQLKDETIESGESLLSRVQLGDVVTIANNARYIGVLENGGSDQAPRGIVRPTLAKLRTRFGRG